MAPHQRVNSQQLKYPKDMAEPQFPVASDDFFNRDIKPLRNTFGLTSRESSSITQFETQELQPQLQQMMQLRSQLLKERNSELAYQRGLQEFEEKKRQAQEEINFGERTEEITKSLNNIIEDPNKNNFQKQREIAAFGMKNAQMLSKFPAAGIIFRSAENSLKSRQAESDSANKNLQTTSRMATSGIDPVKFNNFINSDGIVTPAEAMEEEINQANWNKGQAIAGSRAATANQAKLDAEEKELDDVFNRDLKELTGIESFITKVDEDTTVPEEGDPNEQAEALSFKKGKILRDIKLSDGRSLGELGVVDTISALKAINDLRSDLYAKRAEPAKVRGKIQELNSPDTAGATMLQGQTLNLPKNPTPEQQQLIEQLRLTL